MLFSTALGDASKSLVSNANLISKIYFPRLIVPAAAVVTAFVDFLISFVNLLGLLGYYQFVPGWNMLLLPLFVVPALLVSLGPGLWITALNVKSGFPRINLGDVAKRRQGEYAGVLSVVYACNTVGRGDRGIACPGTTGVGKRGERRGREVNGGISCPGGGMAAHRGRTAVR